MTHGKTSRFSVGAVRPSATTESTRLSASTTTRRRLDGLLLTHIEEARERDESNHAQFRAQELCRSALSTFRYMWRTLIAEVQTFDPEADETDQDDLQTFDRFLVVGPDRLHVELRAPAERSVAVLIGELRYSNADTHGMTRVANIVCTESGDDDSFGWRVTRYGKNDAYPTDRPEIQQLKNQGVDLALLEEQLKQARQPLGAAVLIENQSGPMTTDALLTALVDGAESHRTQRA